MILQLKYEDITASGVRGDLNGKNVNFFMRIQVDEINIEEALVKFKGNKWVAAFDYVGEPSFLRTVDIGDRVVIVTKQVEKIDMNVDFLVNDIDKNLRIVLNLPEDYNDMKLIFEYSAKYPNVRFTGGRLLRLDGCSIGSLTRDDLFKKVGENRIPLVLENKPCLFPTYQIDDLDVVEFYEAKLIGEKKVRTPSTKSKQPAKPKKQLSSLLVLSGSSSMDNF
jgi:hypothetical protein